MITSCEVTPMVAVFESRYAVVWNACFHHRDHLDCVQHLINVLMICLERFMLIVKRATKLYVTHPICVVIIFFCIFYRFFWKMSFFSALCRIEFDVIFIIFYNISIQVLSVTVHFFLEKNTVQIVRSLKILARTPPLPLNFYTCEI